MSFSQVVTCPTEEDIKYRMTRVSVDLVELYLVESGVALEVQLYPLRLSTCNLHGKYLCMSVCVPLMITNYDVTHR